MIRRIELRNFMSHAHTVLEPADGLTVLVGPNNCGKSAVVEALRILCTNDRSNYVTRHGERECSITVETDDGHVIEWRRRRDSVSYTIDGQKFDRLGGNVPEALHEVLCLPQVEAEGGSFDIHFGSQKQPIFLLDRPSSHAAQFFASSSDASRLIEMQARHREKVKDARRDENRLAAEAQKQKDKLTALEPVPDLVEDLEQIEADHQALIHQDQQLKQMRADEHELRQLMYTAHEMAEKARVLKGLSDPPVLTDTQTLNLSIDMIDRTTWTMLAGEAASKATADLEPPPRLADTAVLAELITAVDRLQKNRYRMVQQEQALKRLCPPPELTATEPLITTIHNVIDTEKRLTAVTEQHNVLDRCDPPPVPEDDAALKRTIEDLENAERTRARWTADLALLTGLPAMAAPANPAPLADLLLLIDDATETVSDKAKEAKLVARTVKNAEQELRQWVNEQETCPTCGAELDPDQLIEQAATGLEGHAHD
ncbi:MAG: AAA family ATPase [Phycisphaeraceae bacterium]